MSSDLSAGILRVFWHYEKSLEKSLYPQAPVWVPNVGTSPAMNRPEGAVPQKNKEKCTGKSPDPNPCMLFIANIYFLVRVLEMCFLQSQIEDKDIQCTVLNVKPSGFS